MLDKNLHKFNKLLMIRLHAFLFEMDQLFFFFTNVDHILIPFISVILYKLKMMGICQYSVVLLIQLVYTVPVLLNSSS